MKKKYFSHLDKNNYAKIVNINTKKITKRTAIAEGRIKFSKLAFNKILKQELKKGELKNISIIAGIIASKKTSDLIPLCHNIPIEDVIIKITNHPSTQSFKVVCKVVSSAKTGVEMEALTGVSVTCLTIYDMCKSIDKAIIIKDIKLIKKTGGKSRYLLK